MSKKQRKCCYTICMLLFLIATETQRLQGFAEGVQRRIHVSDDLNDVVDNEEDEEWRHEWGNKKSTNSEFDQQLNDPNKMSPSDIQAEMMKRVLAPLFGFVKLRLGTRRTPAKVSDIAKRWISLARTGAIETKFIGVDSSTIMFTMEKGQDTTELKEFLLEQPEAYEIKIGDQLFRRPGDPPFEEVFEKLQNEEEKNRHSEL